MLPLERQSRIFCRCSSVVEHVIGNDGVASPILASGTIKKPSFTEGFLMVTLERTELRSKCGDRAGRSSARESERSEAFRLRRVPAGAQACQRHHFLKSTD